MKLASIETMTIEIGWYGPFEYVEGQSTQLKESIKDETEMSHEETCGLYQIYGNHPVFGRKSLLYIGQAWEQSIYERVRQHWFIQDEDFHEIEIYIGLLGGRLGSRPTDDYWAKLINISEMLLICAHKPPFNRNYITDVNGISKRHRVFNYGQRANILMEVSYERISEELDWDPWE